MGQYELVDWGTVPVLVKGNATKFSHTETDKTEPLSRTGAFAGRCGQDGHGRLRLVTAEDRVRYL